MAQRPKLDVLRVSQEALPFFIFFALVFSAASKAFGRLGLNVADRALLASTTQSLSHGIPATILAFKQIRKRWPLQMDAVNDRSSEQLVEYTLGYMVSDSLLYVIPYSPTDYLFLIHHLVVIWYAVTTLSLGRGALSFIVMLWFGECTSLWQNSWYLCTTLYGQFKILDAYSVLVSWAYPLSYLFARSIFGPPGVLWLCWKLWKAHQIPAREKGIWITICLFGLAGSQLWTAGLLKTFWFERQENPAAFARQLEESLKL